VTRITLRRKVEFSAAHFLPESGTHCANAHGHNYLVEAFVTGNIDAQGMIKPFEEIKRDLKEVVHDRYDHQTLNSIAPFDNLMPTTENLALVFLEQLRKRDNRYTRVRVWETDNNYAEVEI
jgi:6-pyruvoyltetrahydropterin/6-carboxytetrahydropterin synthase